MCVVIHWITQFIFWMHTFPCWYCKPTYFSIWHTQVCTSTYWIFYFFLILMDYISCFYFIHVVDRNLISKSLYYLYWLTLLTLIFEHTDCRSWPSIWLHKHEVCVITDIWCWHILCRLWLVFLPRSHWNPRSPASSWLLLGEGYPLIFYYNSLLECAATSLGCLITF